MNVLRFLSLVTSAALFAACASNPPQSKTPLVLPKLQAMGISSATYSKIANHRVLTYDDIYGLLKKNVPSPVILTYIQSTKAPYTLTDAQLNQLNDAGASADLLNYLGKSVGFFEATQRSQTGGENSWKNHPYFYQPGYLGPPPFMYGYPGEWFDPGWVGGMF